MSEPSYKNPIESDPGTIAYQDSKVHELPYQSLFEDSQAAESTVVDFDTVKSADEWNAYHGPTKSGQRGALD